MEIIKFDLEELKKKKTGFSYYVLGRSYDLEENGVEQEYKTALNYYKKGLELNYPLCMYMIGISYEFGLGDILPIDKEKAKEFLIKAKPEIIKLMNNRNASKEERLYAKFTMGAYYYFGLGDVEKDESIAFMIINECAKEGHLAAIYDLGANFYYNGVGTPKDIDLANYYLNLAKENGLPRAIKLSEKRMIKK